MGALTWDQNQPFTTSCPTMQLLNVNVGLTCLGEWMNGKCTAFIQRFLTSGHSKHFTTPSNIHPFMHTFTHHPVRVVGDHLTNPLYRLSHMLPGGWMRVNE